MVELTGGGDLCGSGGVGDETRNGQLSGRRVVLEMDVRNVGGRRQGWAWPCPVAEEGRVSGRSGGSGRLSYRIYGDFAQLLLDCGQAATESLDFCGGLFFFCPGEREKKHIKFTIVTIFKYMA